jgi:broad specificity phosphatase PhoE
MSGWLADTRSALGDDGATVFAFTHGGAIRSLAASLSGWSHEQTYATRPANASVSLINEIAPRVWSFEYVGLAAELALAGDRR